MVTPFYKSNISVFTTRPKLLLSITLKPHRIFCKKSIRFVIEGPFIWKSYLFAGWSNLSNRTFIWCIFSLQIHELFEMNQNFSRFSLFFFTNKNLNVEKKVFFWAEVIFRKNAWLILFCLHLEPSLNMFYLSNNYEIYHFPALICRKIYLIIDNGTYCSS